MNELARPLQKGTEIDYRGEVVMLAPDTTLTLFLDGSSIMETLKSYMITECCWTEEVFSQSFIHF